MANGPSALLLLFGCRVTGDDFHFSEIHQTEPMTLYLPGGYHPIVVGDILGPSSERQYRIMHKLGWGAYSTVWLAQKRDSSQVFVSVKVSTADDGTTDLTREVDGPNRGRSSCPDSVRHSHFARPQRHPCRSSDGH